MAPVGAWGRIERTMLQLSAAVLSADGAQRLAEEDSASSEEAEALGRRVAESLLAQGAGELIETIREFPGGTP
jgi:hydroxymethylbilane synthase